MFQSSKDLTDMLALLLLMPSSWANSSTCSGLLAMSKRACTIPMVLLTPQCVAIFPQFWMNCCLASVNDFEFMNTNNEKQEKKFKPALKL